MISPFSVKWNNCRYLLGNGYSITRTTVVIYWVMDTLLPEQLSV